LADGIDTILRRMKTGATQDLLGKKVRRLTDSSFVIETPAPGSRRGKTAVYTHDGAVNLLTGGVLGDVRYYEPHRLPKWNIEPNLLTVAGHRGGGSLARRLFPELSKDDHARRARDFAERAGRERREYGRALDAAIKRYGDVLGHHTSGIYNPDFPSRVKDILRAHLGRMNDLTHASIAHYEASGRRTPWRDSELKAIARPAGSMY